MTKEKLIGQATDEQIKAWKLKHGKVFAIKVDGHICYLRKPDRATLSYASTVGVKDPIKFNEILLNNTWLAGSEAIKTDDELFLSVSGKLVELVSIKDAELVNL
jgi:hypothetical protein